MPQGKASMTNSFEELWLSLTGVGTERVMLFPFGVNTTHDSSFLHIMQKRVILKVSVRGILKVSVREIP